MSLQRNGSTRRVLALLLGCAVSAAGVTSVSSPAVAAPDRSTVRVLLHPDGSEVGTWSVRQAPSPALVWRADGPLPVTSARPEIRIGDRVIGYPTIGADRRTLTLSGADIPDTGRLQVWLGSRRLDGPTPPARLVGGPDAAHARAKDAGVDPAKPGASGTESFDYRMGRLPWRAYESDMEVLGHAVLPRGVDDAPLVLFLHGRHNACYGEGDDGTWPCKGGSKPVPSYLGYDYLQRRLATQGYATVSISANAVNQQDFRERDGGARARSALVRHHLRLLAARNSAAGNRWSGRLDLDQVVLVGHSRGGEGVNQAVVDTGGAAPYSVVGQFLIAPTDFAEQTAGYMPTVVALPYCDGDVSDLQGQKYVDASVGLSDGDNSVRSSVLVRGANHNYFNTEWTPGISAAPSFDDWYGPQHRICGPRVSETRLNAAQQRKVGLTLTTGAVRMFVRRDPEMLRIFDAPGAITTASMGTSGLVWSHAVGGARTSVRAGAGATVVGAARECLAAVGVDSSASGRSCAAGLRGPGRPVHWAQPFDRFVSRAVLHEARLRWDGPGRSGGLRLDDPLDAGSDATVDLRLIGTRETGRVRVALRDSDGTTWSRGVRVLRLLGAADFLRPFWAQTVRLDPSSAPSGFDAGAISSIRVIADSDQGSAWIVDAAAREPALPEVPDRRLPRLRLGAVTVQEGDGAGHGTAHVPYRLLGPVSSGSQFDVAIGSRLDGFTRLVNVDVPAGQRTGSVAVRYPRNSVDDHDRRAYELVAQAVHGVALSKYQGRAVVLDDDPAPRLTLKPKRKTYTAGELVRVRLRLSRPSGYRVRAAVRLRDVKGFAAMRGTDVPRRWLRRHGDPSHPKRRLSRTLYPMAVRIPAGRRSAELTIPTVSRGPRAATKRFRLVWRVTHQKQRTTVATIRPPGR